MNIDGTFFSFLYMLLNELFVAFKSIYQSLKPIKISYY